MPDPLKSKLEFEVPFEVFQTLTLAALSGVRSSVPPALLAGSIRRGETGNLEGTPFEKLGLAAGVLSVLMAGEMLADKTSLIPARTSAGPAAGRAVSGALVGATLFTAAGRGSGPGALAGGASAIVGLYAADRARKWASESAGIPDPLWGVLEDALTLGVSRSLLGNR